MFLIIGGSCGGFAADNHPLQWTGPGVGVAQARASTGRPRPLNGFAFAPAVAYEVEFHQVGHDYHTRALLLAEQVQVEEDSPLPPELRPGRPREQHAAAVV